MMVLSLMISPSSFHHPSLFPCISIYLSISQCMYVYIPISLSPLSFFAMYLYSYTRVFLSERLYISLPRSYFSLLINSLLSYYKC
ncbi:hypothetical protein Hanom_Chr09g00797311 [Helianthus anomalus]